MLISVNSSRAAVGLRPYSYQADLSSVARRWAQHMAATGLLQHNPSLATQVTGWRYVGENVGYGPSDVSIETAFMASPPHRANILDHDFTQVGIGEATWGGRVWVSQVFRAPVNTKTTSHTITHSPRPSVRHPSVPPARRNPFVRPTTKVHNTKKVPSNYRAYVFPKDWRQYRAGEQAPNL